MVQASQSDRLSLLQDEIAVSGIGTDRRGHVSSPQDGSTEPFIAGVHLCAVDQERIPVRQTSRWHVGYRGRVRRSA